MITPAKKLGNLAISEISNIPVNIGQLKNEFGIYKDDTFYGIRYYTLDQNLIHFLKTKVLPVHLYDKFDILLMLISYDNILPHTDSDIRTVINYYVKTSDAVTHFWKLKSDDGQDNTIKINNQTDGAIYPYEDLDHLYEFKAKDNDLWVLNVKQIHSVSDSKDTRLAYCFQSKIPYDVVIKELNLD